MYGMYILTWDLVIGVWLATTAMGGDGLWTLAPAATALVIVVVLAGRVIAFLLDSPTPVAVLVFVTSVVALATCVAIKNGRR